MVVYQIPIPIPHKWHPRTFDSQTLILSRLLSSPTKHTQSQCHFYSISKVFICRSWSRSVIVVYVGTYSWRFLCGHILLLLRLLLHQLNGLFFGFNFLQLQSNRETFKLSTSSLLRLWALGGSRKMRLKLSHKQQQHPLLPIPYG